MTRRGRVWWLAGVMVSLSVDAGAGQDMPTMPGMHDMASMTTSMSTPLEIGDSRHASGTAWLPDNSATKGLMRHRAGWMLMAHGQLFLQYIDGSSDRSTRQFGSVNWFMGMARHDLAGGQVTARIMLSAERLTVGLCGYPDLLQTGPVCGEAVRDLQHPHDLFMELGADYRRAIGGRVALEVYGGLSGEPALGPVAYPHRLSAAPNPIAPIAHHWLDVTHVSFGVVTGGVYGRRWKAEGSAFNGRHSDDRRYGFDLAAIDSLSGRVWWLPGPSWSVQVSSGRLLAPSGHNHAANAPNVATVRTTASVTYHRKLDERLWASTMAWGQNTLNGKTTGAFLAETALQFSSHDQVFGRGEVVEETNEDLKIGALDLFETHTIGKLQGGYVRTLATVWGLETAVGGSVGIGVVPTDIVFVYGRRTPTEFSVFLRLRPAADMGR